MTGEGKAKHKTEPRAGRGEAHRVRPGKAVGAGDARACLGKGTAGRTTHAHAWGRVRPADDARTCQGESLRPDARRPRLGAPRQLGGVDGNTGEMTGVVTATASPDGQTVTQAFQASAQALLRLWTLPPPFPPMGSVRSC